jgi:glycerophosphoryl diester phosphodiesterase
VLPGLPHPTIFAHRGASAHSPENTLASFTLALRQNVEAIELDAKLSSDGQIVVIHDQTVDRTTDGSGRVNQLPLAALKELDAGTFYDIQFTGEKIPTLEEVFEAVGRKLFINVELTNYASPRDDLPQKVVELIKKHNLQKYILFSSFNPFVLSEAKHLLPEVPTGMLASSGITGAWARNWPGVLSLHDALHPEKSSVNPNLVNRIHARKKRIHVWTVNQVETMEKLFHFGVDGIFTDDPLVALSVRNDFLSSA